MAALSPEFESPPHSESFTTTHALTLILTVVLLLLFFVGFFSIYFCRCFMENLMGILNNRRSPMGAPVNPATQDPPGLDQAVIDSFPAFDYSSVKDYSPANHSLECAICLSEFLDDDILRLIPECCHVFHKDCIDLWLASHTSCPVCRRALNPATDEPDPHLGEPGPPSIPPTRPGDEPSSYNITVKEDAGDSVAAASDPSPLQRRFSRSHSTGHSIMRPNDIPEVSTDDKYTLRLPDHVKETMTRGHVQTSSCTTFEEMSRSGGQGRNCFGEI